MAKAKQAPKAKQAATAKPAKVQKQQSKGGKKKAALLEELSSDEGSGDEQMGDEFDDEALAQAGGSGSDGSDGAGENDEFEEVDEDIRFRKTPAPKGKKGQLIGSDDEEDADEDEETPKVIAKAVAKSNSKRFSDENAKWLKLKGRKSAGSNEEEDDDEEEDGEDGMEDDEFGGSAGEEGSDEDDEDDEEADDDLLPIERKARKLDAQRKREAEVTQAELQAAQATGDRGFHLPTAEELEAEKESGGLDMHSVHVRIQEVTRVLANFGPNHEEGRSRGEYVECLQQDLATYYGYVPFLIEKFLHLFPIGERPGSWPMGC
eukprot:tig00000114_g6029.t1